MAESLVIAGQIELLNGGYTVSTLPQCAGAQFGLGGLAGLGSNSASPDWDFGTPVPVVDVLGQLLIDGERPFGRRFSNRTITLPVVIRAPDPNTLAGAREALFQYVDQQTFTLTWKRSGGASITFDCFRAAQTMVRYALEDNDVLVAQVLLTFQALPYGRSATLQQLLFSSPLTTGNPPPPPVTIDDFSAVSSTTQAVSWSAATLPSQFVVGAQSAHWDWDTTNEDTAPVYTHTIGTAVNITGLTKLSLWVGLGSPENYTTWHRGKVTFKFTLNDASGHTITFGVAQNCIASNTEKNPTWNLITVPIPQNVAGFDYTHIQSWAVQAWRFQSDDGDLELDADVFLNALVAQSSTFGTPATSRGTVYQLLGILGSARTPLALQATQTPNPVPTSVTFSTPGPINWVPPSGVNSYLVQEWAAGGRGGRATVAGGYGGGMGGQFVQKGNQPCQPGVAISGYVGLGGGGASPGAFVQRVAQGSMPSTTQTTFSVTATATTTRNHQMLCWIGGGSNAGNVSSVKDARNNVWTNVYRAPTGSTAGRILEVWMATITTPLVVGDKVTITLQNAQNLGAVATVDEYSNLGAQDNTPVFTFAGSQVTTGSVTGTMGANETIAVAACMSAGPNQSQTVNTPFTSTGSDPSSQIGGSTGCDLITAYDLAPAAGSLTATFHQAHAHTNVCIVLAFAALPTGPISGADTWFGANDATSARGGNGVPDNTVQGAVGYADAPANQLLGQNAGFEGGIGNWNATVNCSIAGTSAQAHSGASSLQMTSTAAGNMVAASTTAGTAYSAGVPCAPGQIIQASAWFLTAVSARSCNIGVEFFDNTDTSLGVVNAPTSVTDSTSSWVQSTGTFLVPANAQTCRATTRVQSTAAGAEVHFVDDVFCAVDGAMLPNFLNTTQSGNIHNDDFEGTVGTWVAGANTTIGDTASQFHTGVNALQLTSIAAGTMTASHSSAGLITTQGLAVAPGDAIGVSGWFRSTIARVCNVGCDFYDVNGNYLSTIFGPNVTSTTTGWTQATDGALVIAPANAAFARETCQVQATAAANEIHYFDDATMYDGQVFDGGTGANGAAVGGGGGSSAGTASKGNNASGAVGGAAPTGGAGGGAGGAAGSNPGSPGAVPGAAGGGAVTAAATEAAGSGANGQIIVTYTSQLSPFKTLILHTPSLDAPASFVPMMAVGNGVDPPDGREYPVPPIASGVPARFGGTYTVILTNFSWSTPASPSTITVTVKQYEYVGGPSYSASVTRTVTPNNLVSPDGNGIVIIDNITLPVRDIPPDNGSAYFTVNVTDTVAGDRFLDVIFIDTDGQFVLINNPSNGYTSYWLDMPTTDADLGDLLGSSFDRSQAISMMQYAIISGGPMTAEPGNNLMLAYAVEGQPALGVSYYDRYWVDDPQTG